jgi:signal transduction histidine kinase
VQEDNPDLLLAAARLFLAVTSLIAIWLDSTEPARLAIAARGLLILYATYSASILIFERTARNISRYAVPIHVGDIAWAAVITSITEGPNSPFFLLFLFALIAAAYRWDMRRVMLTAAALITVLVLQAATMQVSAVHNLLAATYEVNRFIMRAAYLLAGSIVIGYIGDNEKRLIREAAFVGALVSIPRAELGLKRSAHRVTCEIARFFRASEAAILIRIKDGDTYLLELSDRSAHYTWSDLAPDEAQPWLFSIAADCAWIVRNVGKTKLPEGEARWRSRKSRGDVRLPMVFVEYRPFNELLLANLEMGEEWSGRIFLFDPQPPADPISALDLLDRIVRQVTPAVHNVYLLRRIRERAQAVQRSRLAHELHDGAIQALVAANLQLEAFHRKHLLSEAAVTELRRTQDVLRTEIFNLRMIMQDLHWRSAEQTDLVGNLQEIVNNFRRSTDLQIELLWNPESMKLPRRVARETLRLIQEALLNIHRHSGAKHAGIELNNSGSRLEVTVADDGAGLGFDGHLRLNDLDQQRIGPRVIKQRLHDLGGTLVIESHPHTGTRLEMSIPLTEQDVSALGD